MQKTLATLNLSVSTFFLVTKVNIKFTFRETFHCHINHLKAELNPICYLLTLLGAHHILYFSRVRVNGNFNTLNAELIPICHLLTLL